MHCNCGKCKMVGSAGTTLGATSLLTRRGSELTRLGKLQLSEVWFRNPEFLICQKKKKRTGNSLPDFRLICSDISH